MICNRSSRDCSKPRRKRPARKTPRNAGRWEISRSRSRRASWSLWLLAVLVAGVLPASPARGTPPSTAPASSGPESSGPESSGPESPKQLEPARPEAEGPTEKRDQGSPHESAEPTEPGKRANRFPPNRLADETSPYLLQHAHNPVRWYPWGDEALARAKRENKVIFLSVGYSSCHWCHVMERESFMDREIADYLNEHFVCVKVDREERPDVDAIYMLAVQAIAGRGGWPMSVFLTPDAKPFFGGTYFPARDGDRPGITGFLTLLKRVQDVWSKQPDLLRRDAERLTQFVNRQLDQRLTAGLEPLDADWLDRVQEELADQYDERYGGFGFVAQDPNRPKFPEPSNLLFLLHRVRQLPETSAARQEALDMLQGTLDGMARGGIRDHVGGGFHRYSVDRYWRIPHFEKMLYDNGQLASVYSEAYELTEQAAYRRVVEELLEFVLRELTSPDGGFYSALDAESEHEEGKFYRWTRAEIQQALGDDYPLFAAAYGLADDPNFEERYYVPQLPRPLSEIARQQDMTEEALRQALQAAGQRLLQARAKRPRPLTDDKVLTGWNGLMIRGFADAGRILREPRYLRAAERAANFVLDKLRTEDGRLLRTYGKGEAKLNGYLTDYAFLVDGLIGLHQATGDARWLDAAVELTDKQLELFWDERRGGFFFTSDNHESLIARVRDPFDGAEPAGNSVAADNLLYLARFQETGQGEAGQRGAVPKGADGGERPDYRRRAERTINAVAGTLRASPLGAPRMAVAASRWLQATADPAPPPADKPAP